MDTKGMAGKSDEGGAFLTVALRFEDRVWIDTMDSEDITLTCST